MRTVGTVSHQLHLGLFSVRSYSRPPGSPNAGRACFVLFYNLLLCASVFRTEGWFFHPKLRRLSPTFRWRRRSPFYSTLLLRATFLPATITRIKPLRGSSIRRCGTVLSVLIVLGNKLQKSATRDAVSYRDGFLIRWILLFVSHVLVARVTIKV